jgi:hypothetical protein
MSNRTSYLLLVLLVAAVPIGCFGPPAELAAAVEPAREEVELAVMMGEIQRHSTKLGYSLVAQNQPLAMFYLEELGEVASKLVGIEEHDGLVIGSAAGLIIVPLIDQLMQEIEAASWERAAVGYTALIDGCNRCHAATAHEFIQILEAQGPPPYNQAF